MLVPLLLGACATLDPAPTAPAARDGLNVRNLETGECGLYVWTADARKRFILFASIDDMAVFRDNIETPLVATSDISDVRYITFTDYLSRDVALTLREDEKIEGGVRYKAGSLAMVTDEGWDEIQPVVGLYACQLFKTT